jgi:hypothetical protein
MRLINVNVDQKVIKDVLNVVLREENVAKVRPTLSLSPRNLRALPQEKSHMAEKSFRMWFQDCC